jgi:hypothetical protein
MAEWTLKSIARRLPDWLVPTLEEAEKVDRTAQVTVPWPENVDENVARLIHDGLAQLIDAETDRMKVADTKLIAVGAVVPIATAIVMGIVTFLTSRTLHGFTATSLILLVLFAWYIVGNLLIALRAAIRGLQARSYEALIPSSLLPHVGTSVAQYLSSTIQGQVGRVEQNREATNGKFSQLKLAHAAMQNAVVGLLLATLSLGLIVIVEALWASAKTC